MDRERLDGFVALSAALTGHDAFRLSATGQAALYLATASEAVGEAVMRALLAAHAAVEEEAAGDEALHERGLRRRILGDETLGPVARAIIKLWYVGTWYQLPAEWRAAHGARPGDRTHIPSPDAYTEGLLWPTIGASPQGAKPLGYGMWATPPRIETV